MVRTAEGLGEGTRRHEAMVQFGQKWFQEKELSEASPFSPFLPEHLKGFRSLFSWIMASGITLSLRTPKRSRTFRSLFSWIMASGSCGACLRSRARVVSILVLLDHGLRLVTTLRVLLLPPKVSILVLLDHGLRLTSAPSATRP